MHACMHHIFISVLLACCQVTSAKTPSAAESIEADEVVRGLEECPNISVVHAASF